jgi:uncharacterized integral membrane protein
MMPWRLVLFLVALALMVAFAGFNLDNTADVSFGFYTIPSVPIFISLFTSFLLGAVVMLPFSMRRRRLPGAAARKKDRGAVSGVTAERLPAGNELSGQVQVPPAIPSRTKRGKGKNAPETVAGNGDDAHT